ncbi:MAG: UPF0182 family membrane protein [Candidatus Cyclobacteriaceae bacterium M3_2C_046]
MYTAIFLILFGGGLTLFILGLKNQQKIKTWVGALVVAFTLVFYWFMGFWGEMLWFQSIGYGQRFWIVEFSQIGLAVGCLLLALVVVYGLTFSVPSSHRMISLAAMAFAAIIAAGWGYGNWEIVLKFWFRISTDLNDPILGNNTGFYLFTLPFLSSLQGLLLTLTFISLVANVLPIILTVDARGNVNLRPVESYELFRERQYRSFYLSTTALFLVMAFNLYLQRFELMYSEWGAVSGPGWTDVHIRLPMLTVVYIITALVGLAFLFRPFRKIIRKLLWKLRITSYPAPPFLVLAVGILLFSVWILLLTLLPGLFQWLRVEPNEITFERPYIINNITFTRYGFNLHQVEDREFPASDTFNIGMVQDNQKIFNNIRLWDYRALDNVYKQFQEIRLYYEFNDVDIDRYTIDGNYQQVMVSAREMEISNLPAQSQTFVNQRFKYTHGFGITLSNVNDFTAQGLPDMLIKDIPPKSTYPDLEVEEPRIYYGEATDSHVIVNTDEPEFDYPSGEENIYIHYPGTGGVQLSNIWRKFLFGYKFDGTRLFFSSYPNSNSRIMFHRNIRNRVRKLAPFLSFDNDPYIILSEGRLYWMIDAYTTSANFPYSEPFEGINYLRNSVKIVVDAFNGSVDFYLFSPDDPIIQVYDKIFPGMFKPRDQMPESLEEHIRYPIDMLEVQGMVFAKYHMNDPTVFYNQEDLWIRATEKYYDRVQPVEPYYIIWESPGSDEAQYVLMMPFTPKNRQVMIGWIAGMCDPPNYGKFIAYQFPKDKRVLGPQQVETKIDQDSFLSGQLSLWDQRGSSVIRGNVLAIPIENTILYVEPIYLQAETAAYPELRLVAVMHNDNLSYAETFDQALAGLFGEATMADAPSESTDESTAQTPRAAGITNQQLIIQANQAFENYIRYTGERNFQQASEALNQLEKTLNDLSQEANIVSDTVANDN